MKRQVGTGVVGFNPAHSDAYSYVGASGKRGKMLAVNPNDVVQYGWQQAMVLAEQRKIDAMNFKNRAQRRKEARANKRGR